MNCDLAIQRYLRARAPDIIAALVQVPGKQLAKAYLLHRMVLQPLQDALSAACGPSPQSPIAPACAGLRYQDRHRILDQEGRAGEVPRHRVHRRLGRRDDFFPTSSDRNAPDIFEVALKSNCADAVAIGDTPYDAEAAGKARIATIGVLCGGFTEASLRRAGCVEIYPGPAVLFALFKESLLAK